MRRRAAAGEKPADLARAFGLSWTGAKKIITGESFGPETPEQINGRMRTKDGDLGFDAALKASGCHRVRFHDLRHTYASHFMMAGGNILALRDLLGHHHVKVTEKYAHFAKDYMAREAARVNFEPTRKKTGNVVALAQRI